MKHSEDSSKNVRINEEDFIICQKRMRYQGESYLSPKQTNVPNK